MSTKPLKIYTSYFARLKELKDSGIEPISIARYNPRWAGKIKSYKKLAPTSDMLKMKSSEYDKRFQNILDNLNANQVLQELKMLAGDAKEIALLCYEKPGDPCHRHKVSEWLTISLSIQILEYENTSPQIKLFDK